MKQKRPVPTRIHRTAEDWVVDVFVHIVAVLIFIVCFYPFYLAVVMAFNEGRDATQGGIFFWPRKFTLENFRRLLEDPVWANAVIITILRTVIGTVTTTLFTAMVAYGLSERTLVFRKIYMAMLIIAMYFSGGIIPYFAVLRSLHLINNFLVYIIPGMLNLFFVLVSISFFRGIPKELCESARIDGAGEMKIFSRIILPISLPLLATIAIFTAVGHWNAWFDAAFFIQNKNLYTLGYQLMSMLNQTLQNISSQASVEVSMFSNITTMSVQVAAMLVAVVPILVVYPFFQRYFISGLTIGSVKA
ncbi:MAG: carbohydrate ABC transporter permease [Treponema sp.]|jgi:putative aldouronate transport system permease protein|nr:carbohydrate ABC transporter permease [Treponema sp.]